MNNAQIETSQTEYAHLVCGGGPVVAAKNVRIELKRAFPGVKFSVTTSKFSMGNSINIDWTDGPTSNQVTAITDKYTSGDFDGMNDLYTYKHSEFTSTYGSAKYISFSRHYSPAFIDACVSQVVSMFGGQAITAADYLNGGARFWNNGRGIDLCRELNIVFADTAAK